MAIELSDEEWKKKLTPEQYRVLREGMTEYPGTGELLHNGRSGEYRCAACGQLLFMSDTKYESQLVGLEGWPSFADAANNDAVELKPDNSLGMARTEVICKNCGSHLGHIFDDPSSPSGQHYCINSVSLDFNEQPKL
jgi:peptide-methionine (R)-S-oxide reductase